MAGVGEADAAICAVERAPSPAKPSDAPRARLAALERRPVPGRGLQVMSRFAVMIGLTLLCGGWKSVCAFGERQIEASTCPWALIGISGADDAVGILGHRETSLRQRPERRRDRVFGAGSTRLSIDWIRAACVRRRHSNVHRAKFILRASRRCGRP